MPYMGSVSGEELDHWPDKKLADAVQQVESAGDPKAVSSAGAQGLMQLMPGTQKDLGVTDPFDPVQNRMGGEKYLAQLIARFKGDTEKAIAAYNTGPNRVDRLVKTYGEKWKDHLFDETKAYLPKVSALAGLRETKPRIGTMPASELDSLLKPPLGTISGDELEALLPSPANLPGLSTDPLQGNRPDTSLFPLGPSPKLPTLSIDSLQGLPTPPKNPPPAQAGRLGVMSAEEVDRASDSALKRVMKRVWGQGEDFIGGLLAHSGAKVLAAREKQEEKLREFEAGALEEPTPFQQQMQDITVQAGKAALDDPELAKKVLTMGEELAAQGFERLMQVGERESFGGRLLEDVAVGGIMMVPALIGGVVAGPVAALSLMFPLSYGSRLAQGQRKGLSLAQNELEAGLVGTADTLSELVPISYFLSRPGKRLIAEVFKGAAVEAPQEMFVSALEEMIDAGLVKPEMTLGETWQQLRDNWLQVLARIGYSGLVGAGVGGVLRGGITAGVRTLESPQERADRLMAMEATDIARRMEKERKRREKANAFRPEGVYTPIEGLPGLMSPLPEEFLQTSRRVSETDDVLRREAGDLEGGGLPRVEVPSAPLEHRVFFGAPVEVKVPSLDYVQSGTGGLLQGYGLYFSDLKEVADYYRENFSRRVRLPDTDEISGEVFDSVNVVDSLGFGSPLEALRAIVDTPNWKEVWDVVPSRSREEAKAAKVLDEWVESLGRTATTHEAEIDANPEHYLDLDAKLEEQSSYVKDKILKDPTIRDTIGSTPQILLDGLPVEFGRIPFEAAGALTLARELGVEGAIVDYKERISRYEGRESTAVENWKRSLRWLEENKKRVSVRNVGLSRLTGMEILKRLEKELQDQKAASNLLHSLGIPGNKYRTASTRGKEGVEPKYNYVVFDPAIIKNVRALTREVQTPNLEAGLGEDLSAVRVSDKIAPVYSLESPTGREVISRIEAEGISLEKPGTFVVAQEGLDANGAKTLKVLQPLVEHWRRQFTPTSRVVLSPGTLHPRGLSENSSGQSFTVMKDADTPVIVLEFSPKHALAAQREFLLGTAAHEFGHALLADTVRQAPPHVQQALRNSYRRKVERLLDTPWENVLPQIGGPRRQDFLPGLGHSSTPRATLAEGHPQRGLSQYLLSANEYLAEQMSRAQHNQPLPKGTEAFFKDAQKKLERYYNSLPEVLKPANPTFDVFLDNLRARRAFEAAAKGVQGAPPTPQRTGPTPAPVRPPLIPWAVSKGKAWRHGFAKWVGKALEGVPGGDILVRQFRGDSLKFNKWMSLTYGLLNIQQANPTFGPLKSYLDNHVRDFWNIKSEWNVRAGERLRDMRDLSRSEMDAFRALSLSMTLKSMELGRRLSPSERRGVVDELAKEGKKFTPAVHEMYDAVRQDFLDSLQVLEKELLAHVARTFEGMPKQLAAAQKEIAHWMAELYNQDYFPLSRFGRMYAVAKATKSFTDAEGTRWRKGDIVNFQMFDGFGKTQERDRAVAELERKYGDNIRVHRGIAEDTKFAGDMLPLKWKNALETKLGLDAQQQELLKGLLVSLGPSQTYLQHLRRRKGTPGFTTDVARAYAEYFMRFGGHLARIKHAHGMEADIDATVREGQLRPVGDKYDQLAGWMRRHKDYLFNPQDEWSPFRTFAFFWHLGYAPASALVNLTQVPLVTYPYLASRYGDGKAVGELLRAYRDASVALIDPSRIEPELSEGLRRGVKEQFLDESFASEMAGTQEGGILTSTLPRSGVGRGIREVGRLGAMPFKGAEMVNRRVSYIAAFRLARNATGKKWADLTPAEQEAVHMAGRDAVQTTQFEYSKWNRPEFMRGKVKSVVFLFWMYMRNALRFMASDPGRMRALLMLMATAGITGLPFAKDAEELLNAIFTKWPEYRPKMLGDQPLVDIEQQAREYIADSVGPEWADFALKGASRFGFGLPWLGEMMGVPVPMVDLSASLSLGDIAPMTQVPMDMVSGRNFESSFMRAGEDLSGAAFAIPINLLAAVWSNEPDTFKRWERALPRSAKGVARAIDIAVTGKVRGAGGSTLLEVDWDDPRQVAEVVAQGLSFTPTEYARAREANYAGFESTTFYLIRKELLLAYRRKALKDGDAEAVGRANAAIVKYNASVPDKTLAITAKSLQSSLLNAAKREAMIEAGLGPTKQGSGIFREVQESYPMRR